MTTPNLTLINYEPIDPLQEQVEAYRYKRHDAKPFGAVKFEGPFEDLLGTHVTCPTKEQVGGFGFYTLKEGVDADNSRANTDVDQITALVYDFDDVKDNVKDLIISILQQRKIAFIYFTTHSHRKKPGLCRFRIIIPIEKSYSAELHEHIYVGIFEEIWGKQGLSRKNVGMDNSCKNPARYFYALACPEDRKHEAVLRGYPGRLFDVYRYLMLDVGRHDTLKTLIVREYHKLKDKEAVHKKIRGLNAAAPSPLPEAEVEALLMWADGTIAAVVEAKAQEDKAKGKIKRCTNEELMSFVESLEPKFYWRTYEYKFKNEEGQLQVYEQDSTHFKLAVQFEKQTGSTVSMDKMAQAFFAVADREENRKDTFKERLESVVWDGKPRISSLFQLREDTTHVELRHEMVKKWLISIVARTLAPPGQHVKADNMLVLVGEQGLGKSTFFKTLFGAECFGDTIHEISPYNIKDVYMQIRGKVACEIAEMEKLFSKGQSLLKAFLSQSSDDTRDPYARKIKRHDRRCVFVGSTNEENFLTDHTGNRRYWVLPLAPRTMEALDSETSDQVLAEAVYLFKAGEKWWFAGQTEQLVSELNTYYLPTDELAVRIIKLQEEGRLPDRPFSGGELCELLCVDRMKYTHAVGRSLRKMGFISKYAKIQGVGVRLWSKA